jgi:hypothetical protein
MGWLSRSGAGAHSFIAIPEGMLLSSSPHNIKHIHGLPKYAKKQEAPHEHKRITWSRGPNVDFLNPP